jgi:DNA-directed RNA polymerase specialized sigma subunit
MTVENDRYKKRIAVGKLTEAYVSIPKKIERINDKIDEIMKHYTSVSAVSFESHVPSGKTNDEKLAEMVTKLDELNKQREDLRKRQEFIYKSLGILNLSDKELLILAVVYNTDSYKEAGEKTGYSKTQIYRVMEEIYRKVSKYI